jgi:hypothetical protein
LLDRFVAAAALAQHRFTFVRQSTPDITFKSGSPRDFSIV